MVNMTIQVFERGGACDISWKSETFDKSTDMERDAARGIQDILERGILARTGKRNMARDGEEVS